LDQTGLTGVYNLSLHWSPEQGAAPTPPAGVSPAGEAAPPDTSGPSLFTALQEQLGLKLEATKGPVEVIVIDHIERPSEN
jgi:bla regulator protein blaR1